MWGYQAMTASGVALISLITSRITRKNIPSTAIAPRGDINDTFPERVFPWSKPEKAKEKNQIFSSSPQITSRISIPPFHFRGFLF